MQGLQPTKSNGVIYDVRMLIFQKWMHWTAVAAHLCLCGAGNWKSMSPKIHPVKPYSGKDARPPEFKTISGVQKLSGAERNGFLHTQTLRKTAPLHFRTGRAQETHHEKKHNILIFYWAPVFTYCLLIFIQSSYPSAISDPGLPHIDKLAHFLGYALLGVLFFRAFMTLRFRDNDDLVMILSMVSSVLYGMSDEIHQHYVPSRSADITDLLADTLGSFCGVFFYQLFVVKYYELCKATLRSLMSRSVAELNLKRETRLFWQPHPAEKEALIWKKKN